MGTEQEDLKNIASVKKQGVEQDTRMLIYVHIHIYMYVRTRIHIYMSRVCIYTHIGCIRKRCISSSYKNSVNPTVFTLFYRLSLGAYIRRSLKVVAPEGGDWAQESEEGSLFSITFVPFEFCSLGVYKLFNSKIFYLKILS